MEKCFYQSKINEIIWKRIYKKSFPEGKLKIEKEDLRYLCVLHYGFDHQAHRGEIIVNKMISNQVLEIFQRLFDLNYQIEKIKLVDEYDADDNRSMEDNNSSGFNYRVIQDTNILSNHSFGLAIDINPLYNPYVRKRQGIILCAPEKGAIYMDRRKEFPHKIHKMDVCYQIFAEYGFHWGGDWEESKDYQHFEKESKLRY